MITLISSCPLLPNPNPASTKPIFSCREFLLFSLGVASFAL